MAGTPKALLGYFSLSPGNSDFPVSLLKSRDQILFFFLLVAAFIEIRIHSDVLWSSRTGDDPLREPVIPLVANCVIPEFDFQRTWGTWCALGEKNRDKDQTQRGAVFKCSTVTFAKMFSVLVSAALWTCFLRSTFVNASWTWWSFSSC